MDLVFGEENNSTKALIHAKHKMQRIQVKNYKLMC